MGRELIVLAPGVREFGEDRTIDTLIRRYGYCGTPATLEAVKHDAELAANLSAAAHLIHGSSEGRFGIRYCPGHLTRAEIEGVGVCVWGACGVCGEVRSAEAEGWVECGGRGGDLFCVEPGVGVVGVSRAVRSCADGGRSYADGGSLSAWLLLYVSQKLDMGTRGCWASLFLEG